VSEYCDDSMCKHKFPHSHETTGMTIPGQPAWNIHWHEFVGRVETRLDAGEREYGDKSFTSPPLETLREIEEELLDVVGWGYIMWTKMRKISKALEEIRREAEKCDHVE